MYPAAILDKTLDSCSEEDSEVVDRLMSSSDMLDIEDDVKFWLIFDVDEILVFSLFLLNLFGSGGDSLTIIGSMSGMIFLFLAGNGGVEI